MMGPPLEDSSLSHRRPLDPHLGDGIARAIRLEQPAEHRGRESPLLSVASKSRVFVRCLRTLPRSMPGSRRFATW